MRTYNIPYNIILHIFSYTYNPQPPKLLYDIQNYYTTKNILLNKYNEIWISENIDLDFPNEVYIINDFANILTQNYTNSFYYIFFRNYMINNKKDVVRYMRWLDTILLDTQINIYWGLLTSDERDEFIQTRFI
jgi:hypothetical protein